MLVRKNTKRFSGFEDKNFWENIEKEDIEKKDDESEVLACVLTCYPFIQSLKNPRCTTHDKCAKNQR